MNTVYALKNPRSFEGVETFLGGRATKKVAHNTYAHYVENKVIDLTYHGNKIIRFTPDAVLCSHAGWPTSTTADRFTHLTPFSVRFSYSYIKGPDGKKAWRAERENATILVAGIALPDSGSAIALAWDGTLIKE